MNLDTWHSYVVVIESDGSYISGDSTKDNIFYEDYNNKAELTMTGEELILYIVKLLQDTRLIDVTIRQNEMVFDYFEPYSGEADSTTITVKEQIKDPEVW